jgi:hypothetical protein
MTGKQLYEAIHPYMMKLALIKKEKFTRRYHPKILFIQSKDDLSYSKTRRKFQISPLDGAHYAKFSSSPKQTTRENNAKYNSKMNIRHTLIVK